MKNLIGISGYKGSGKDTVGRIIQYLEWLNSVNSSDMPCWEDAVENGGKMFSIEEESSYKIKKFANPLKQMVCILLGCSMSDLEDHGFKEKELGEEWWIYKTRDYGDYTIRSYKNNSLEDLHRDWKEVNLIKLTPRKLLQLLGTECGRQIIHPNIWINALFSQYEKVKIEDRDDFGRIVGIGSYDYPNWIITDVRFPNEAKAIKDRGGIIIRVNRGKQCGSCESTFTKGSECPNCRSGNWVHGNIDSTHPSETALDDYEFDYVIENDGSLVELVEKVKSLNLVNIKL